MAPVLPLKKQASRTHPANIDEAVDDVIVRSIVRSTSGPAFLWTDANTTSITIGGGTSQTSIDIGKSGQTTALNGGMSVVELADFDAGITIADSQAVTGDGSLSVIATGGTNDLTLGARSTTITLNETGNTSLSGFTSTSIVGALNELKSESGVVAVTLTNNSGVAIPEGGVVHHTAVGGEISAAVATADNMQSIPIGFAEQAISNTTSGSIIVAGLATVRLTTGLVVIPGIEVLLSLTSGECTVDVSGFTPGNVIQSVGVITDDSSYFGSQTVEMIIKWGPRIVV